MQQVRHRDDELMTRFALVTKAAEVQRRTRHLHNHKCKSHDEPEAAAAAESDNVFSGYKAGVAGA